MPATIINGPMIAQGESLSSIINASTGTSGIARITMPDDWTSAWLTFQISQDGNNFSDLCFPNGAPVVVTVTPGVTVICDPATWQAAYFKFRSGSRDQPIPQLETRNFSCVMI